MASKLDYAQDGLEEAIETTHDIANDLYVVSQESLANPALVESSNRLFAAHCLVQEAEGLMRRALEFLAEITAN